MRTSSFCRVKRNVSLLERDSSQKNVSRAELFDHSEHQSQDSRASGDSVGFSHTGRPAKQSVVSGFDKTARLFFSFLFNLTSILHKAFDYVELRFWWHYSMDHRQPSLHQGDVSNHFMFPVVMCAFGALIPNTDLKCLKNL